MINCAARLDAAIEEIRVEQKQQQQCSRAASRFNFLFESPLFFESMQKKIGETADLKNLVVYGDSYGPYPRVVRVFLIAYLGITCPLQEEDECVNVAQEPEIKVTVVEEELGPAAKKAKTETKAFTWTIENLPRYVATYSDLKKYQNGMHHFYIYKPDEHGNIWGRHDSPDKTFQCQGEIMYYRDKHGGFRLGRQVPHTCAQVQQKKKT